MMFICVLLPSFQKTHLYYLSYFGPVANEVKVFASDNIFTLLQFSQIFSQGIEFYIDCFPSFHHFKVSILLSLVFAISIKKSSDILAVGLATFLVLLIFYNMSE